MSGIFPSNSIPSSQLLTPSESQSPGGSISVSLGYIGTAIFLGLIICFLLRLILLIVSIRHRWHSSSAAEDESPKHGTGKNDFSQLPTFVYHAGKNELNGNSSSLECVVCISEISEGEVVRLLPACKHFFHVKCIDMWLRTHASCPVCRAYPESEKVKFGGISTS